MAPAAAASAKPFRLSAQQIRAAYFPPAIAIVIILPIGAESVCGELIEIQCNTRTIDLPLWAETDLPLGRGGKTDRLQCNLHW